MRVNVRPGDPGRVLDLPEGYRQTSALREMGERALDDSNEAFILAELRALDLVEGTGERSGVWGPWTPDLLGDWRLLDGCVVYRCDLTDEEFRAAAAVRAKGWNLVGWVPGWTFDANGDEVAAADIEIDPCPALRTLLGIRDQLANCPVLDGEDYDERCHEARIEMVLDCQPEGASLTHGEASRIVHALSQYSWPPDDPNDSGIAAKYQVSWSGDDDYHIAGNDGPFDPNRRHIDLEACVRHAIRQLRVRFYRRRKAS